MLGSFAAFRKFSDRCYEPRPRRSGASPLSKKEKGIRILGLPSAVKATNAAAIYEGGFVVLNSRFTKTALGRPEASATMLNRNNRTARCVRKPYARRNAPKNRQTRGTEKPRSNTSVGSVAGDHGWLH